ncbi:MAG: thermonuclease family protein [Rickettsiales bacterium]|jgi:endonuclease YncB( thermonuclease family)|nr:thermonuclease family protein [Rickettsiales bacterium]
MKKFLCLFIPLLLCPPALVPAAQKPPSKNIIHEPIPAVVTHIIDGDTFSAKILLKQDIEITVRVRIMQIDAPEIHGMCESETMAAMRAKDRLEELIPIGSNIVLTGVKDDKYLGRIDAYVAGKPGSDIGEIMVRENHARRYGGGKRDNWCE